MHVRNEYPNIYIYLPNEEVLKARIYSAYECKDMSESYRTEFGGEQDYTAWIEMTYRAGVYADFIGEQDLPTKTDKILTLSTCTNRDEDKRYVVQAFFHE